MYCIDPPEEVMNIIDVLMEHGYEAYTVGGCIRDCIMGRQPKDWDIATNAYPDSVKGLFERTLDTGLSHGTVTVMMGSGSYEVTTFRIDGRYEDGRHPEYVEFTRRLEDDLKRRDFTINSMAWNAECGIIDLFGGMGDIAARIVRAVGAPAERFREDALRMLRAVRFAARLGFGIEKFTFEAIKDNCALIRRISAERIRDELTGILTSDDPGKFTLLAETGLLGELLEKFGYGFDGKSAVGKDCCRTGECSDDCAGNCTDGSTVLRNLQLPEGICLSAVGAVDADACLRWAMLLRCFAVSAGVLRHTGLSEAKVEEPYENFLAAAKDLLSKLKFSNRNLDRILRFLKYADMRIKPEHGNVAKAVSAAGEDIFSDLLKLKRAVALMHDNVISPDSNEHIDEIDKIYCELLASGRCLKLKDLAVSGQDLIRIGYREGIAVGNALSNLLDRVLLDPELNRREILEKIALDYLSECGKGKN